MIGLEKSNRILTSIRNKRTARCRLDGDDVTVEALPGNLFRITGPAVANPTTLASDLRLVRVGADVHVEDAGNDKYRYVATATWDTALHHLVRTGDLDLA